MSPFEMSREFEPVDSAAVLEEDRRSNSRAKFRKQIHIRHAAPSVGESSGTVIDLSRDGLYFTTPSTHFQVGMQLQMTFPDSGSECTGEVVRIEALPQGRSGIGVRILGW
jgi:hypothetical protein